MNHQTTESEKLERAELIRWLYDEAAGAGQDSLSKEMLRKAAALLADAAKPSNMVPKEVLDAIRAAGLTLLKTQTVYELRKLGKIEAQPATNTERTESGKDTGTGPGGAEPEYYTGIGNYGERYFYHKGEVRPRHINTPLYTHPQAAQVAQPLTFSKRKEIADRFGVPLTVEFNEIVSAVETAHGITAPSAPK